MEQLLQQGSSMPSFTFSPASQIQYVNPTQQSYFEYFDHLRAFNDKVQRDLSRGLEQALSSQCEDTSITTTGSDARLEKGPVSLIEIVLLSRDGARTELAEELLRAYMSSTRLSIFDELEIKYLQRDKMYECVLRRNTPEEIRLISPNRIFDALHLCGSLFVYHDAKSLLVQELISPQGKTVYERIKDKVREHRHVSQTGLQRYKGTDVTHFDLDAGISYYDPKQGVHSFKQGPLRVVQYALVRDCIHALRAGIPQEQVLDLSGNTIDKLHALEVAGLTHVSHDSIRELSDHYKYFLWLYHKAQEAYASKNIKETGFDAAEVRMRCTSLAALSGEPLFGLRNNT